MSWSARIRHIRRETLPRGITHLLAMMAYSDISSSSATGLCRVRTSPVRGTLKKLHPGWDQGSTPWPGTKNTTETTGHSGEWYNKTSLSPGFDSHVPVIWSSLTTPVSGN